MGLLVRHVIELLTTLVTMTLVTLLTAAQPEATRTFSDDRVDAQPAGFKFTGTEQARPDKWVVRREGDNNVLVYAGDPERRRGTRGDPPRVGDPQRGDDPQRGGAPQTGKRNGDPSRRRRYALAILDGPARANGSIEVNIKHAGRSGRGGVVWRYQDPLNYYTVHLDLDEADQDIALYRVVKGNRTRIGNDADLQLRPSDWHVLKVSHENETIRVYLGGVKVFDVQDKTFRGPGAVGLWSALDSVMYFDDLSFDASVPR
jgi:hypothetical protein